MRIESLTFDTFRIYDAERSPGRGMLDPITVCLRDVGGGGQIIVECYGAAWSHWFGALGSGTLRELVAGLSENYLATKLVINTVRRVTKREEAYVTDIARAIISAIRGEV